MCRLNLIGSCQEGEKCKSMHTNINQMKEEKIQKHLMETEVNRKETGAIPKAFQPYQHRETHKNKKPEKGTIMKKSTKHKITRRAGTE